MEYQQIDCVVGPDCTRLCVWVEARRVRRGDYVTFKETGDKLWKVTETYGVTIDGVNRGWGLNLPKSQRTER